MSSLLSDVAPACLQKTPADASALSRDLFGRLDMSLSRRIS
jgi:hypothetical protein